MPMDKRMHKPFTRGRALPDKSLNSPFARWTSFPVAMALLLGAFLAGCTVGPNYVRPTAPVPAEFKEAQGWKIA